jgi:hypothetical protein
MLNFTAVIVDCHSPQLGAARKKNSRNEEINEILG